MARRIGRELQVRITPGGIDDGTPNWAAAPTEINAVGKMLRIREGGKEIDVSGWGEDSVRTRFAGGHDFEITLEVYSATNEMAFTVGGASPIGHYIRVEVKPIAAAAAWTTYEGIITGWEMDAERQGEQTYRLTVRGPADL